MLQLTATLSVRWLRVVVTRYCIGMDGTDQPSSVPKMNADRQPSTFVERDNRKRLGEYNAGHHCLSR
jgi:hypothetical protein